MTAPVEAADEAAPKRPEPPNAGVEAAPLKAGVLAGVEAAPKLTKPLPAAADVGCRHHTSPKECTRLFASCIC